MQGGVSFGPPRAGKVQLPFHDGFAPQDLYLLHAGCAGNIQYGGRRLGKTDRSLCRKQLFEIGCPAHPTQRDQFLLHSAVREGRNELRLVLGVDGRHQPKGPPHLNAAGRDGPAVDVLGLPFHLCRPGRKGKLRQLQLFGERQFLFRLAQARPVLALIIDGAAQVSIQVEPPGLQLLLQHHRPHKALDQLEHRGQIIGDQDLRFQRELCLDGAPGPRLRQIIPEDLQFHATRSFPVRLVTVYARAWVRMRKEAVQQLPHSLFVLMIF